MHISFGESSTAHKKYSEFLQALIVKNDLKTICEIGGGANPSLTFEFIKKHNIDYTILDISSEELEKAPAEFKKIQADIASTIPPESFGKFDLVFSRMVAEHVKDDQKFHFNTFQMLKEGGRAFHFFPTLWTLPYLVNMILPEWLTYKILLLIDPNRRLDGKLGKFPAYYKSCRGPCRSQIKKFENWGYTVLGYHGFFGHGYYYRKIAPIRKIHEFISGILVRIPIGLLTSYAYVILKKTNITSYSIK